MRKNYNKKSFHFNIFYSTLISLCNMDLKYKTWLCLWKGELAIEYQLRMCLLILIPHR